MRPGERVGPYTVIEKLGRGGMGVVYRARDERLERDVALKFLPFEADDDPKVRERFLREARAASALDHANVCTVHDVGEASSGEMYLCMAYYDGESLARRLARGPLDVAEAVSYARQAAAGLGAAHRAGILHRDVKPANLMLTGDGVVKVVDFGLAALAGEHRLTRSGATVGTLPYMSPEQLRGEPLDSRTDLWSLGAVLYEMLTGRLPFPATSEAATLRGILEDEPPPPSSLRPDVPPWLDRVVLRLLTKDRAARPGDAVEVAMALREQGPRLDSHHETTAIGLPPVARRSVLKPALWALGAVAVGSVLALVLHRVMSAPAGPAAEPSLAVMPFANYTGDDQRGALAEGLAAGLITRLGEVRGLRVVSRTEAWPLAGQGLGATEIGARLGVGLLLDGSVAGSDPVLDLTAELVDVPTGTMVWSESLEGTAGELYERQGQLARRLAEVLQVTLSRHERDRLASDPTRSFRAYEAYLEAESLRERATDASGLAPATEMYRQAIRLDQHFALAWAGLSTALWERAGREGRPELRREADEAARRAVELDAELPAAQVALARALRASGGAVASIRGLEAALERHPHPDEAHRELARSYERAGDLAAAEDSLRAATAAGPESWRNWNQLGGLLWKVGRYDEAGSAFERAATIAPTGVSRPRENLIAVEVGRGRFEAAIEAFEGASAPVTSAVLASNIGTAYYFSDRADKWERAEHFYRLAVRLNPGNDGVRRNLGDLLLRIGRTDEALAEYGSAFEIVSSALSADPGDPDLRLSRAHYAARLGECDQAVTWAQELQRELPQAAASAHDLAVTFALCGAHDEAMAELATALEMGVPAELVRGEDEFSGLRQDPRFEELLSRHPGR